MFVSTVSRLLVAELINTNKPKLVEIQPWSSSTSILPIFAPTRVNLNPTWKFDLTLFYALLHLTLCVVERMESRRDEECVECKNPT